MLGYLHRSMEKNKHGNKNLTSVTDHFSYWTFRKKYSKTTFEMTQFSFIHIVFSGHHIFHIAITFIFLSENVKNSNFMSSYHVIIHFVLCICRELK